MESKDAAAQARGVMPSRRVVLLGGAVGGAGLVAGCDLLSTEPDGSDGGGAGGSGGGEKGVEAPELAELVEAGDLPRVEDRLPDEPLVVEPTDEIGVYGGTWSSAVTGSGDIAWLRNTLGYDGLVRWSPDWQDIVPNIAESFEIEDEGREFTFVLRPGMKWSDGEPFTANDIVFAYENLILTPEIATANAAPFTDPNGEMAQIEPIDDHTVRFTFATPKGFFLEQLADPEGYHVTACPRHYLEQFHPDHNPDIDDLLEEAGAPSWVDLMEQRRDNWNNPELPVVFAWRVTTPLSSGSEVVAERNPYYWKVDPESSQLPYLDQVTYPVISDTETMLLRAADGEVNMHTRHFNIPSNRPVLADSRETGNFDFFDLQVSNMNEMIIMLNLNSTDPQLRELFQNRDFRIGLSHAINREEMISTVFQQQGEPWQAAPSERSDFYDEEFAKQYTEYDVDLANEHLDEAGITERDDDGYRLLPGTEQRVFVAVDVPLDVPGGSHVPAMELVKEYWDEVGVEIGINELERSAWTARVEANEHGACVWGGGGGFGDEILNGFYYLPFHGLGTRWAVLWAQWYETGGESGEEPPEHARQQLEIYDQVLQTVDPAERAELFTQVLQIAKEQFYEIGTVIIPDSYGIVANNFHNVRDSMPLADHYATPGPSRPEQYYIEDA